MVAFFQLALTLAPTAVPGSVRIEHQIDKTGDPFACEFLDNRASAGHRVQPSEKNV